jgi:hypothetical protein
MRLGRLLLIVAMLVMILAFPLFVREAFRDLKLPSAYATSDGGADPAGRVYQNGNNNDNEDGDDDDDNGNNGDDDDDNNGNDGDDDDDDDDDDNDNEVECFLNLNSNEEVPCDFVDNDNVDVDNDNVDNDVGAPPVRRTEESRTGVTKCFDTREVGVIQLGTGDYDATVEVLPHSSFGQTTRLTLRALDPASVPAPPGSLVDRVVFALDAQSDCVGAAIGTLPNQVNLGITYNVTTAVEKSRLQIARLEGGSWVNVDTVPDPAPGNPYVSTTINMAGTYALFQR